MDLGLAIAVLLALAFATTNGLHDASNPLATGTSVVGVGVGRRRWHHVRWPTVRGNRDRPRQPLRGG